MVPAPIWRRGCCSPPSWRNPGWGILGVSTASHFCTAERQYRFPLEYGGQRPPTSQWTVTGGGAVVVTGPAAQQPGQAGPWIQAAAIGTIEDKGIQDAANMGAAMAPAAAATILGSPVGYQHHPRGLRPDPYRGSGAGGQRSALRAGPPGGVWICAPGTPTAACSSTTGTGRMSMPGVRGAAAVPPCCAAISCRRSGPGG